MVLDATVAPQSPLKRDLEASAESSNSFQLPAKEEGIKTLKSGNDIEVTPSELDWESPADPANPRNWSTWNKVFHTAIPAVFCFVISVGSSVWTPAIPLIMKQYGVSREVAILPLSLYVAGFSIGPVVGAPLSELYGRRAVYLATMPLLLIFTAISGAANNVPLLIVMRLLAGSGGSAALAVGAGSIADLWSYEYQGKAALFYTMAPFLGPALGPLIGAYIIEEYDNNWRYSMWVVMFIAAPIAILLLLTRETFKGRILYLKHKQSGLKLPHHAGDTHILLRKLRVAFIRPVHMMLFEPLVAYLSIYTGFAFAMMFSFFGSYTYVFRSVYHFNPKEVGLAFIGILIGFLLAIASFGIFDATLYKRAFALTNGSPAPEHRLYSALLGSILLPVGLFWFAWSPNKDVHWIVPVLAGIPFGWGCLSIFLSTVTYLVAVYHSENGASALAANGILRSLFGAAFPLFTIQMYEAIGVHWAGSVFAFVGLAQLPVPWIFFWKGRALRARSYYNTSRD